MFSHDITNFEAYCSWWAFPAWESPTISMRKPGKKHNQIDVRLQCNTPKRNCCILSRMRLFYYLLNIFSFGTLKFMKTCPVIRFFGHFFAQTFIRFSWEILPGLGLYSLHIHIYVAPHPAPRQSLNSYQKNYCWKAGSGSTDYFKKALSY